MQRFTLYSDGPPEYHLLFMGGARLPNLSVNAAFYSMYAIAAHVAGGFQHFVGEGKAE